MTDEAGETGVEPTTPPRRFGQLPNLSVPDDFDEPLSPADDGHWLDWPIDEADFHEALRESEADLAAGRTFGEDEIRARYGLPRSGTGERFSS